MPAKRGERKETNDKKTLLISLHKKKRTSVGTVFISFAHCLRCCIRRGRRRQCRHKNSDCGSCCGRMRLCRRYTCRKYEKENTMTVPQGTVLSCKI